MQTITKEKLMLQPRLLTLLLLLTTAHCAYSQQKLKTATSPFKQVDVPDSVLRRINKAIKRQEKLPQNAFPVYIFDLANHNNYVFRDGIYSYKLSSPHAERRILIVHKGATTLFEGTHVNDVLREYLAYIEKKKLPTATTIRYLNIVGKHLQREYDAN
ncbi:hypothetical protein E5K00_11880 [Hymenobacter aquaticus]|uniref:Uncharacterized protein n=1 Tax=Hymenobacter aquaticus TaxID=1867101 RepID=A0A4Z0Q848_9BACT|nr:hypothetical protein [Hymenobacter aquaticus]TGE25854.1 hypothetical protein E5K00_11880 [Hymenobacter aquaticus]